MRTATLLAAAALLLFAVYDADAFATRPVFGVHSVGKVCHEVRGSFRPRTRLLQTQPPSGELIGEDAGAFSVEQQSLDSWKTFSAAVATVLGFLAYVWVYEGGPQGGNAFKEWMEGLAGGDSTLTITYMLGFFAVAHSGLASLRPAAEEVVGARAWRVFFALVSLPLAFSCIVYFINHRYDGIQLWDLRSEPWMHDFVWWTTLISFFFLYPSTFNLLEVAAVDKPKLHLWETGITRITRHPQAVGQLLWCTAHTAYIGTSFMCATSFMLCAHHFFAVWNGDRRLRDKYGDKADAIRQMTSVVPFAAIIEGRQKLPDDYWRELLRPPYLAILVGTLGAYYAHPFMQAGSTLLKW
jgi:zeta-carotene isomerase